jgi:hypothetical protein
VAFCVGSISMHLLSCEFLLRVLCLLSLYLKTMHQDVDINLPDIVVTICQEAA